MHQPEEPGVWRLRRSGPPRRSGVDRTWRVRSFHCPYWASATPEPHPGTHEQQQRFGPAIAAQLPRGKNERPPSSGIWVVEAPPHVIMRVKRIFGRASHGDEWRVRRFLAYNETNHGVVILHDTAEICEDL